MRRCFMNKKILSYATVIFAVVMFFASEAMSMCGGMKGRMGGGMRGGMGSGMMQPGMHHGMGAPGMMHQGMGAGQWHHGMQPGMMGAGQWHQGMQPGMMGAGQWHHGMQPGRMGAGHWGHGRHFGPMGAGPWYPGMRHGTMGPGGGYWYPPPPSQIKMEDAQMIVTNYLRVTRNPNIKLGKIEDKDYAFEAQIVTEDGSLVDKILVNKTNGWIRSAY